MPNIFKKFIKKAKKEKKRNVNNVIFQFIN